MARGRLKRNIATEPELPAPHPAWRTFRPGDAVTVVSPDGYKATGVVDSLTDDATTVWVYFDDGRGRSLVHCNDNVGVTVNTTEKPSDRS